MASAGMGAPSLFKTVLNTLDAASLALTVCDVAADVRVSALLPDSVAALLVIDGTMYLDRGGERQVFRAGEMAMIPACERIVISASTRAKGRALDCRDHLVKRGSWLVSDATRGARCTLRVAMVKIDGTRAQWLSGAQRVSLTADEDGARLFALLHQQFDCTDAGAPALALSLVGACIVQALKTSSGDDPAPAADQPARSPSLERALRLLHVDPGQAHRTDTLARAAGMSRSTFIRQLARFAHTSPMEYIQRVRLEQASIMLRSTEAPVKAVAAAMGFRSRSHFSRMFRANYGIDPSAYRVTSARRHVPDRESPDRENPNWKNDADFVDKGAPPTH